MKTAGAVAGAVAGMAFAGQQNKNSEFPSSILQVMKFRFKRREREKAMKTAGAVAGAVAGMAFAGLGLAMLASSSSSSSSSSSGSEQKGSKKLMKAPGAGGDSYIYRDDFERNPAGYFRNNRLKE
ncbi:hypothetical protein TEA_005309 [Camellia sinensis var. sinensis]|uniref:Uncharacterized protein n=1 Tax=Camellia sinensis var. sinensis TaxID=542762 RepID=A0A4S4EH02_CAMSN|nr:hypothetical protein TEA_005309 [Camellia sinensis var. sinensis]